MSSHTPVSWKCPDCGALNSPEQIGCDGCGLVIPADEEVRDDE